MDIIMSDSDSSSTTSVTDGKPLLCIILLSGSSTKWSGSEKEFRKCQYEINIYCRLAIFGNAYLVIIHNRVAIIDCRPNYNLLLLTLNI